MYMIQQLYIFLSYEILFNLFHEENDNISIEFVIDA